MSGPHAIWDEREPSAVKRARVGSGRTLADLAGEVGRSVAQVHRFETRGRGSADLRRRVAAVLGIEISPARGNTDGRQLVLPGASS